jgi:chloramphenicol-sensitive protein RarD
VQRQGFVFGLAAYLLWGAFPLYFPLLDPAGTAEVLACRIVFSAVTTGLLLLVARRLRRALRVGARALSRLALASVLVAVNWGLYIWGVDHHHVVECSLGYFVNPLVTVALGVVVLRERLRRAQWAALAVGLAAVVVITVAYGKPPWLALGLALSFGTYGLLKKQVGVPALEGLCVEAGVLTLPGIAVLIALNTTGHGSFAGHGGGHVLLLLSAGVVTALPLLAFAGAASRLPLSQLGLLQYLTPVLQLAVGVGIRHEPLPASELAGFCLVWVALIVLTVDGWRHRSPRAPGPPSPEQLDEPVLAA